MSKEDELLVGGVLPAFTEESMYVCWFESVNGYYFFMIVPCVVKCLSVHLITVNGPSYGCCSGLCMASCLTNT